MYALIDSRASKASLSALRNYGYTLILMPPADYLDRPVASHTDMLLFIGFGRLFCHARYYERNKELIDHIVLLSKLDLTISHEETGKEYPHDVLFNACLIGNKLICNDYLFLLLNKTDQSKPKSIAAVIPAAVDEIPP